MTGPIADEKVYAFIHEAVDNLSVDRQVDHPDRMAKKRTQMLHSLAVQEIDRWQRGGRRERLGRSA